MALDDVTVLLPYHRDCNREWLEDAKSSIPAGARYLLLENDGELADALNHGLRSATTEYVIRLDADDMFSEGMVEAQLDAIWDVDVTYPTMLLVTEDLVTLGEHRATEFCGNRLLIQNYVAGAGTLMRRQAVIDAGGFRDLDALEDWDLWVRMHRHGARFKAAPHSTYLYRQVAGSRNKFGPKERARLDRMIVGTEPELLATWYTQATIATTYWRCVLPARYLPGQAVPHQASLDDDPEGLFKTPYHRGAAIWQFPGSNYDRYVMAAMQEIGIPVMVEVDDNYLVTRRFGDSWQKGMPSEKDARPSALMHRKICGFADGVIVTTDWLAARYRQITDKPVFVCPNQIDPQDWPAGKPDTGLVPDGSLVVGWMGSASHIEDHPLVAQALKWCSRQPGVEVVVFGEAIGRPLRDRFKFTHIPWTDDLSAYRKLLGLIDVAVCPVTEGAWSSARSDLKILEMAMAGAACVVSDATPYKDWVDGEYVRKARTAKDFLRVVRELVNDRAEVSRLSESCRAHVLAERTMEKNVWRWREAIVAASKRELVAA